MKKKILIILIPLITLLAFIGSCKIYYTTDLYYRNFIYKVTNVKIPSKSEIIYKYIEDAGFGPGGINRYVVFSFEEDQFHYFSKNHFQRNNKDSYYERAIEAMKDDIPEEYIVNLEEGNCFYRRDDNYFFLYVQDRQWLIVYTIGY